MAEELPGGCRGGDQPPGDDLGRRTAATGDSAPAGGRFHGGCAPHCRRRKVRSAPFPPAAKTAPAPLLLLSPPRGARRGPRIETSKRKCAAPGGKEKMFGGSVCASADLLPPAGEGWLSLAAVRDGNAPPLGRPPARGSQGYPQRLSPLPLTLHRRTASGSEKRSSSMRQPPRRRSTIRHGTAAANSQKT